MPSRATYPAFASVWRRGLIAAAFLTAAVSATPSQAGVVETVSFTARPVALMNVTRVAPGLANVEVASNAPFTLYAENVVGAVSTTLETTGRDAQTPGRSESCVTALGQTTAIYTAERQTARTRGTLHTQSVRFQIAYDSAAQPEFTIKATRQPVPNPETC